MEKDINSLMKGMFSDNTGPEQPENTYTYALNLVNEKSAGMRNEKSIREFLSLNTDEHIIGHRVLDREDIVIFTVTLSSGITPYTGVSSIYYVDKLGNITNLIASPLDVDLGFRLDRQIQAEYKVTSRNQRIVYWTDDYNTPKNINVEVGLETPYTDINSLQLFLSYKVCEIVHVKSLDFGGVDVKSGSYQFAVRYIDRSGNRTNWMGLTHPVPVTLNPYSAGAIYVDGVPADTPTTKSLVYRIFGLDTSYVEYEVAVLRTVNSTTDGAIFYRNPIPSFGIDDFVFQGINSSDEIVSVAEVIIESSVYKKAKTISQKGRRLFLANLEGAKDFNYQRYANNIKVTWFTRPKSSKLESYTVNADVGAIEQKAYKTYYWDSEDYVEQPFVVPVFDDIGKGYMRDEVYALGIVLIYKDGSESSVYHIPGREKKTDTIGIDFGYGNNLFSSSIKTYPPDFNNWDGAVYNTPSPNQEANSIYGQINGQERWQLCNTAYVTQTSYTPVSLYWEEGEMAYWQSTELYPDNPDVWNGLENTPIRHHKMPDAEIANINSGEYYLPLGLRFSNIEIPEELRPFVAGIKLVRCKRDKDINKSIVGKGIIIPCYQGGTGPVVTPQQPPFGGTFYYPGFPYTKLFTSTFAIPYNFNRNVLSFYSTECYFNRPAINNANFCKIEQLIIGDSPNNNAVDSSNLVNVGYDGNFYLTQPQSTGHINYGRRITNQYYLDKSSYIDQAQLTPNPGIPFGYSTTGISDCIMFQIDYNVGAFQSSFDYTDPDNLCTYATVGSTTGHKISTYYVSLKVINENQYETLDKLTYIEIGRFSTLRFDNPDFIQYDLNIRAWYGNSGGLAGDLDINGYLVPDIECWGGDTFINKPAYKRKLEWNTSGTPYQGYTETFFCESTVNTDLRNNTNIDNATYWPGILAKDNALSDFFDINIGTTNGGNYIDYNRDYSKERDLKLYYPQNQFFNPDINDQDFPDRIIWSNKSFDEDLNDSYKVFSPDDYYDIQKNRGEIWNLFIKDDIMFVQTPNAIHRAFLEEQSQRTDSTTVFLGTGDLFSLDPRELISLPSGYAGSVSQWAGSSAPEGYYYPDLKRGIVVRVGERVEDISRKGMFNFFNQNMKFEFVEQMNNMIDIWNTFLSEEYQVDLIGELDNPANRASVGYLSIYDNTNIRYILTKRDFKFTVDGLTKLRFFIYNTPTWITDVLPQIFGELQPQVGDYFLWINPEGTYFIVQYDGNTDFSIINPFTKPDKFEDHTWTVSYSTFLDAWLSFYSYRPTMYWNINNFVYSQNTGAYLGDKWDVFKHGDTERTLEFYEGRDGRNYEMVIEVITNKYSSEIKVFDSIAYDFESYLWNTGIKAFSNQDENFHRLWAYNERQSTGYIELDNTNAKRRERTWRISDLRDIIVNANNSVYSQAWTDIEANDIIEIDKVPNPTNHDVNKNWYEKERFRDRFTRFRLFYKNLGDQNYKTILKYIITNFRKSFR